MHTSFGSSDTVEHARALISLETLRSDRLTTVCAE
jgi:hypothetical protein